MHITAIADRIKNHSPGKIPGRQWMTRASVAALLMDTDDGASILLMRRPIKSGDPWSGDMCMPGGRKDPGDNHSFDTVLRETREEIAIDLERDAEFLGRLSDVVTRAHEGAKPMVVTPFVFALKPEATWQLSDEAREIISVPLAFLGDPINRSTLRWRVGPVKWRMPCYHYQNARIWGLTLMMLDELLKLSGGRIPFADNWLRLIGFRRQ